MKFIQQGVGIVFQWTILLATIWFSLYLLWPIREIIGAISVVILAYFIASKITDFSFGLMRRNRNPD